MSLHEDLQVLDEAIATGRDTVSAHAELMAEQMRAAGVSGQPLADVGELHEQINTAVSELEAYSAALRAEGEQVGQAHTESPEAARSGSYYEQD